MGVTWRSKAGLVGAVAGFLAVSLAANVSSQARDEPWDCSGRPVFDTLVAPTRLAPGLVLTEHQFAPTYRFDRTDWVTFASPGFARVANVQTSSVPCATTMPGYSGVPPRPDAKVLAPGLPPMSVQGVGDPAGRRNVSLSWVVDHPSRPTTVSVTLASKGATVEQALELARSVPKDGSLESMKAPRGMSLRSRGPTRQGMHTQTLQFAPRGLPNPFGPRVVVSVNPFEPTWVSSLSFGSWREERIASGYLYERSGARPKSAASVEGNFVLLMGRWIVTVQSIGIPVGTIRSMARSIREVSVKEWSDITGTSPRIPSLESPSPSFVPGSFVPGSYLPGSLPVATGTPPTIDPTQTTLPVSAVATGPIVARGMSGQTPWQARVRSLGPAIGRPDASMICASIEESGASILRGREFCSSPFGAAAKAPPGFHAIDAATGVGTYLLLFVSGLGVRVEAQLESGDTTSVETIAADGTQPPSARFAIVPITSTVTQLSVLDANGRVLGTAKGRIGPGLTGGWDLT